MAQPTLETFQYSEPQSFVVRIGTGTGTVGMLNQIKSVTGETSVDYPLTTVRRIGEATATTIRQTPQYTSTCTITWWDEPDLEDWLAIAGQATPTAGVSLNVANTVTVQVERYVSGTLTAWHKLTGAFVVTDQYPNVDADTTPVSNTITLNSDAKWIHYTAS